MKKLEIIEYPSCSVFIGDVVSLGDAVNTENLNDIFGVVQSLIPEEMNVPRGLKVGRWRHFKGGDYEVLGIARRKKTGEELVIYKQLYDSGKYPVGTLWGRPINDFLGTKKVEGVEIPRFEFVGGLDV